MKISRRSWLIGALILVVYGTSGLWLELFVHWSPREHQVVQNQTQAILFVPGLYGSKLAREEDGRPRFVAPGFSLFGSRPLTLDSERLGIEGESPLVPIALLDSVTIFPGLFSIDVYGQGFRSLADHFRDRHVEAFVYDWRYSINESARGLMQRIQSMKAAGVTDVRIVAHSMGGLVVSMALHRLFESELATAPIVKSVVYVGVPFHGCILAFRNILRGSLLLPAKGPLGPAAMATYPSMFEMTPWGEEMGLFDADFAPIGEEFWLFNTWKQNGWGLFMKSPLFSEHNISERELRAREILTSARHIREVIKGDDLIGRGVKVTNVYSRSHSTRSRAVLTKSGQWIFDPDEFAEAFKDNSPQFLFEDGDGTVTAASARLPMEWKSRDKAKVFESKAPHSRMMADEAILKVIFDSL